MKRILPFLIFMAASLFSLAKTEANSNAAVISGMHSSSDSSAGVVTIPVVVHVLYNTAQQNISDAQVNSQLEVLNRDYRAANDDKRNIPSYFALLAGDAGLEFRLASIDPNGYATTGIIRKHTNIQMFGSDDRIKSSARGGDDGWDRDKYLNIWVGNLAGGILGYTSTLGCAAEKDGVTIQYAAFGTVGTVSAPFNLGRTATHEVAHWLNLKHIWGDAYCGDDEVADTPRQRASNRGRPAGEKFSCDGTEHGDMYMNFMDLTDDAGMFMFTLGQCKRMRALFTKGAQRYALLSSNALAGIANARPVETALPSEGVKQITIFPNPAQSVITLSLNTGTNEVAHTITIFNNIGQPVMLKTIMGASVTIDITSLRSGIYFIKSSNVGQAGMMKFVKK